jgi:phospholipid/cholesterol/gamma-HCH transport system permease protein
MSLAIEPTPGLLVRLGLSVYNWIVGWGDMAEFTVRTLRWLVTRWPSRGTLVPVLHQVGVRSVPVIAVTGLFIGMVLAVQAYGEFTRVPGMKGWMGGMINASVIRELGPVLAATMLAGRVGSAIAAQLGTMRVTEQIDALSCLGANPIHHLVVPRFLACVLLIPLLTVVADVMGVLGGALICVHFFDVEAHQYWSTSRANVGSWDLFIGLAKSMVFGAAIAIISCYRGFHSRAGADGVGRAATAAFVSSFMAILVLDFFLAMFFNTVYTWLWPRA